MRHGDLLRDGEAEGTILLLHGFTGSPESWTTALSRIPGGPAVLAPPLPGHDPAAPPPPPGLSFDDHLDRLLDRIGPPPPGGFRAAGYSMGGRLLLGMTLRRPEAFRSALLLGAHPGLRAEEERRARRLWDERWAGLLEREGIESFTGAWERLPLFAGADRAGSEAIEAQRRIRLGHDPVGLAAAMRALGLSRMPDLRSLLARSEVRFLFAAGAEDARFVRLGEEAASIARRGRFLAVPGAGHNLLLERPDETARLILSLP